MIPYPNIDPVAIHLGPFGIRWYSLAYLTGIMLGWWYVAREHARRPITNLTAKALDDTILWVVIGIVGGGRLGYVLFYKPSFYLHNPAQILHLWEGGMSFHGGLIGVICAFLYFCRKYRVPFFELIDVIACCVPIGLGCGRIANFINGELFGRPSDVPWAMIFHNGGPEPRHPSQLYEAGMEGLILFTVLFVLLKFTRARDKRGLLSGVFLIGYATSRVIAECFREPDVQLGYFFGGVTMGQLLCIPMILLGLYLILRPGHWITPRTNA